jgi:pimeloyl-ACP methyl ester carboxylesterase
VRDEYVQANGLRLHVLDWTASEKRGSETFVLVHGLGSSAHIWDLTGPVLAEQSGLRVVALDQRGHGQSDQPDTDYDFPTVVADLLGCIDALELTEPSIVVGHSWGASVVLHFAVSHPDRVAGIALVDGGTSSPGERWTWEETETRLRPPEIDGMSWSDLRQRMARNNGAYSDPRAEAVGHSLFHVGEDGRVTRRFRIPNHMQVVRAMWEQRPAGLLPRLTCPILILPARRATDDQGMLANKANAAQRALEIQPRARVRWFEDTVHDVPLQRPAELAAELAGFAAEIESAGVRS